MKVRKEPRKTGRASIGPRLGGRGDHQDSSRRRVPPPRFNWAAARRPRRRLAPVRPARDSSAGFNWAAARRPRRHPGEHEGPGADGGFNWAAARRPRRPCRAVVSCTSKSELQLGRGSEAAETTLRRSHWIRHGWLQLGRGSEAAETYCVVASQSPDAMLLQLGRGSEAAETKPSQLPFGEFTLLQLGRGSEAAETAVSFSTGSSREPLQLGRGSEAAETTPCAGKRRS